MRFTDAITFLTVPFLSIAAPLGTYPQSGGYEMGVYFVNWAIYARQHFVTDLPSRKLTKVTYAFANVSATTGEVFLSDEYSDIQYLYPGDVAVNTTLTNTTQQLYGNFNQLFKLKQANRNLKVILSVGGWSFRDNFKPALATNATRYRFAESSLKLIADLGLDGFDIDWEYPADATDAANFVETVKICREMYDKYAKQHANGYHFILSISAPAGPPKYTVMPIKQMDKYVDSWNLMAFDYMGPGFSNFTGHLSNVYPSLTRPRTTDFNTAQAIEHYKANVARSDKIVLGMPLYGRSFAHTTGIGQRFNGSGAGSYEPGVLDYKVLPLANTNTTTLHTDHQAVASWSYDKQIKELVSFDTPEIQTLKAKYLKKQGLGGAWWWDSSSDRTDDKSLVSTVGKALGGEGGLKKQENNLMYPLSRYGNIKTVSGGQK